MITNVNTKYTVSARWILRKDLFYHRKYSIFNIDSKILMTLSPALYSIIKMLYFNALSMKDLQTKNIRFDYNILNTISQDHNIPDLFIESDCPLHVPTMSERKEYLLKEKVPVTTTPMDVELHFTHNCNLACAHCFQSSNHHSDHRYHLSPEEWIDIFKQFERLNVHNVIITGGEPVLYEGFTCVMKEIVTLRLNIVILTNGLLINKDNISLFKHHNVQLAISVDGHNAKLHETLRGSGTFTPLDEILDLLVENVVNINIAHTINKVNLPYLEDFAKYIISKKIRKLSFGIIEPTGRAALNKQLLLSQDEERVALGQLNYLKDKYSDQLEISFPNLSYLKNASDYSVGKHVFCSAGTKRVAISSNGILYPCIKAFGYEEFEIGDLKKEQIIDLWLNSKKWSYFRGGITINEIHECNFCNLKNSCALRNCRLGSYSKKRSLYEKPNNCLKDKIL